MTSGVNYAGSVQHRFSDVTNDDESRPGIRVNMNSRISTCSDQSGKYARGLENYPIILQSHYLLPEESNSNKGRKRIPKMNFIIHEPILWFGYGKL